MGMQSVHAKFQKNSLLGRLIVSRGIQAECKTIKSFCTTLVIEMKKFTSTCGCIECFYGSSIKYTLKLD